MYTPPLAAELQGRALVHLIGTDAGDGRLAAKPDTGAFDHIALAATGIGDLHARLKLHGITFRERKVPGREMHQVFIQDPDGVTIELNYSQPADIAAGGTSQP